ncbi:BMC domain-containing protein [Lacrimispora sp.]|uniref:BMC domain-containing protein n=1 Tax=Lacrimispora sp. TaxID=2719234 RepID=UPI0028B01463|nr:BMC domain-containing protein [Lacrimispora sp.]
MKQALGLVEIQGLSTAVLVADTMVKAANVTILEIENSKGQGYMTVKVAGDVGAVNAAVSAGKQTGLENQKLVSFKVIARPADSVEQIFGAAKNTKTDAPIQPSDSAHVQTQTEKEDAITGKTVVKVAIKETVEPEVEEKSEVQIEVKPEVKPKAESAFKAEIKPVVEPAVESAVQLEDKLEEKPALVEQAAEKKSAQEPQAGAQAELQAEPQAGKEKSSATPSGTKKTAGHKTKN